MDFVSRGQALIYGVIMMLFVSSPAIAGGVGAYFEYTRGDQEIEFEFVDAAFTNNRFGVGLAFDSNVARDDLLNVRATLGYARTENTVDDNAHGGAFDLAAGFGLWRTPAIRIWAGPTFRTSVDFYDSSLAEVLDFAVGGGARLGLNWHFSSRVSVSPSIAYHYLYVRETIKDGFGNDKFDGHEQLLTARLVFFFRSASDSF